MIVAIHAKNRNHRGTNVLRAGLAVVLAMGAASLASPAAASPTPACSPSSLLDGSFQVLTFTSTSFCNWTVPAGVSTANVLLVAGGGAGAASTDGPGAGGGGGLVYRAAGSGGQVTLTPADTVSIRAGAGGVAQSADVAGNNGATTTFGALTAAGGGGGGSGTDGAGRNGGSGGGASQTGSLAGVATPTEQGHNGGLATSSTHGGGGGGGGAAASGATGGIGRTLTISGASAVYSAGGSALNSLGCAALACVNRGSRSGLRPAGGPPPYGRGGWSDSGGTAVREGWAGVVMVRYAVPAVAPGTPGTPTATAGNGQAEVTFSAPIGGATPSSYTARVAAPGDTSKTCTLTLFSGSRARIAPATVSTLACTVTGLTNGASYTFETKASNGADSAWSAPSNSVIPVGPSAPSPPSAPTAVTSVPGTASLAVSWAPVDEATGYTATAQPGPASCTTTGTSCILGATAGTSYTVTVVAHSATGTSDPSAPSAATTPLQPVIPSTPPPTAPITLTTDKGQIALAAPGQEIVVIGTGFAAYSTATVILYSTPIQLGTVTTDGTGAFSVPVTVPADLASGAHTFLATGIDPAGGTRLMALPVTVAPTDGGSTGGGGDAQTGTLPIPAGGSITLLDAAGLAATTVVIPGQGTYALDAVTGIISFVPVTGFVGTATAVRYRITDAIGTVVTGTYTAVVTAPAPPSPPAGKPTVKLPVRIISSTGKHGSAALSCRISRGAIARCTVTATAVVSGRSVAVGHGVTTPKAAQNLKQVTVRTALNALGRSLAARPGGGRFTFTAVVVQRGRTGSKLARGTTTVLAKTYTLPRSVRFGTDSSVVGGSDAKYLRGVRAKLAGAKVITCVGHADSRGSALGALRLSTRRAKAACAILIKGRKIAVRIVSKGEKAPTGKNNTDAGRARNRRVDVTVHN